MVGTVPRAVLVYVAGLGLLVSVAVLGTGVAVIATARGAEALSATHRQNVLAVERVRLSSERASRLRWAFALGSDDATRAASNDAERQLDLQLIALSRQGLSSKGQTIINQVRAVEARQRRVVDDRRSSGSRDGLSPEGVAAVTAELRPQRVELDELLDQLAVHEDALSDRARSESIAAIRRGAILLGAAGAAAVAAGAGLCLLLWRSLRAFGNRAAAAVSRSDARFRAAAEASVDAVCLLEVVRDDSGAVADLSVAFLNRRASELAGTAVAVGQHLRDAIGAELAGQALLVLAGVVASRVPSSGETRVTRSGAAIWLEYQVVALEDGVALSGRDVTVRKDAEATVAASLARAENAERQLLSSLRDKEMLLREIHHRVKNNLQVVSSLVSLDTSAAEPAAPALRQIESRIRAIALLHESLYRSPDLAGVAMDDYLRDLVVWLRTQGGNDATAAELAVGSGGVDLGLDQALPCGLIVHELVSNALKHGFRDRPAGRVEMALRRAGDTVELTVSDDGIGLPDCIDMTAPATVGLQIVNALAQQLGGRLRVARDGGTTFTIAFSHDETPAAREEVA